MIFELHAESLPDTSVGLSGFFFNEFNELLQFFQTTYNCKN